MIYGVYLMMKAWQIEFCGEFYIEFQNFPQSVQNELLASLIPLKLLGANLGRPNVDTLNGSKYRNMKELRFSADNGVWRAAFAFDPKRKAILLVAGDKSGTGQKKFYKTLINKADKRFEQHLLALKGKLNG